MDFLYGFLTGGGIGILCCVAFGLFMMLSVDWSK